MICPICKKKINSNKRNSHGNKILYSEQHEKRIYVHKTCVPAVNVMNRLFKEDKILFPKLKHNDQMDALKYVLHRKTTNQIIVDDVEVQHLKEFQDMIKIKTEAFCQSILKGEKTWQEPQA